ncbi:hypothetical protein EJ110_NYTH05818 [Nymphaea thermarum]|nr:hypothetical protein EJ110_NYTH05818 [Nymphaea thermarum]
MTLVSDVVGALSLGGHVHFLLNNRTRRQELALLNSESVDEVFRIAEESALRELQSYGEKGDKLEKLFKMYAEKVKGDPEKLVFCFDGDKVSPTATPEALGLENDDMLEAHIKTH